MKKILFLFVSALLFAFLLTKTSHLFIKSQYNLVYCLGNTEYGSAFDELSIDSELDESMDKPINYQCFVFDTTSFNSTDISLEKVRGKITISRISPDGFSVTKGGTSTGYPNVTGGAVSKYYLTKYSPLIYKQYITNDFSPTNEFRLIGWVKK